MAILNKSYEKFKRYEINYVLFRKIVNYENFFFDEWYDDIKKLHDYNWNIKNNISDLKAY